MKYNKHFDIQNLGFSEVGFRCPSLQQVINDIASRYKTVVDGLNKSDVINDLRDAVITAMCDGMDEFVKNHPDADPDLTIAADDIEIRREEGSEFYAVQGYTLESTSPVTLSIAREIFSVFDVDELMSTIEDEFYDALIRRIKACPKADASAPSVIVSAPVMTDDEADAMTDAFAAMSHVSATDDIECEEVECEEVECEEVEVPEVQSNIHDPHDLLTKYKANFADAMAIPDIANAEKIVMTRDGNHVVLTATIMHDEGYKLQTVIRYDAKNGGKTCRTTENDGNETHVWSWRTPSLYGWALSTLPEEGGDFSAEVLGKALVQKGTGSCEKWGVEFIKTSAADRNAARGRSGASKESAKPSVELVAADPSPVEVPSAEVAEVAETVATPCVSEYWRGEDEDGEYYYYIANVNAERSIVICVGNGEVVESEEHLVNGFADGKPSIHEWLKQNADSYTLVAPEDVPDIDREVIAEYLMNMSVDEPIEVASVAVAPEEVAPEEFTAEAIEVADEVVEVEEAAEEVAEPVAEVAEPSVSEETSEADSSAHDDLPQFSAETMEFLEKFEHDEAFRADVMQMAADKQSDAERARAEEEARNQRNRGRAKHAMFDKVMARLNHGKPAYVWGPAGTGKNVLAEQIAEARGIPFAPINCLFEKFEVTGFAKPDGTLQETTIFLSVKFGWLLFWDEADTSTPQAGNVMNSLLANGYIDFPVVGRVYAHPNFRCIAAGNTNGRGGTSEYTGRTCLDGATLNRFRLYEVDYDRNVEMAIAKKRGFGEEEVDFIEDFRQAVRACGISHLVSYRQLDDMLDDLVDGLPIEEAVTAVTRDMPKDDIAIVAAQLKKGRNKYSAYLNRNFLSNSYAS